MRWLLIVAVSLVIVIGCTTERRCQRLYPPTENIEKIYIEKEVVKVKDTTVYVELPPIIIERYVDVKDTLWLKGGYSKAASWIVGGRLHGWLKEGVIPVKIEYKKEYVDRVKEVVHNEEKVVEVKYIPKIYKIFALIGLIACFYVIFKVYLFLR
jgi:hypothetical protein